MRTAFHKQVSKLLDVDWLTVGTMIKLDGQIVYEKNAQGVFPSASLIKLAILNEILDSQVDLNQSIVVSGKKPVGGAGVLQLLSQADWCLRDLLALMISDSDNFASNILIHHFSTRSINHYLEDHHFQTTRLNRYLMDSHALEQGVDNQTNAAESLRLLEMALSHGDIVTNWFKNQQFRYKLPGNFDESGDAIQVFNKTGEGNQIDHDVARFVYGKHSLEIAMLTLSTSDRMNVISIFNQIGQLAAEELEQIDA